MCPCRTSGDQPYHRASHTGRQGAGEYRLHSQLHDLVAPCRCHRADTADHDAQAAQVGKPAHRVDQYQARAFAQHLRWQGGQVEITTETAPREQIRSDAEQAIRPEALARIVQAAAGPSRRRLTLAGGCG